MQSLCKNEDANKRPPQARKDHVKLRFLAEEHNEKHLWKAVICQAIQDATSNSIQYKQHLAKQRAIKWLTEDNDDFKIVCDLAGYSYKQVQKNIKKLIKPMPNLKRGQFELFSFNE